MKYIVVILLLAGCGKSQRPQEILDKYRHNQEMNELVVDIEGNKCIDRRGTFKVYKTFGLDMLPIVTNWSCKYPPERLNND